VSDPGFNIPTNRGMMDSESLLGELLYINYAFNRDRAPHITPEQWAKCYPEAAALEARYQAEKALAKAAS